MDASIFDRFAKQIYATADQEISCSECLDLISDYVDAKLDPSPQRKEFETVAQHLVQCKVCREEYEILRDLATLEMQGQAPDIDALKQSS